MSRSFRRMAVDYRRVADSSCLYPVAGQLPMLPAGLPGGGLMNECRCTNEQLAQALGTGFVDGMLGRML